MVSQLLRRGWEFKSSHSTKQSAYERRAISSRPGGDGLVNTSLTGELANIDGPWRGAETGSRKPAEYNDLSRLLYTNRNSANGLNTMLATIHDKLVLSTTNALTTYIETLHSDLSGNDERKGIITWYISNIDHFLGAAFCLQLCGLALQIFMCLHTRKQESVCLTILRC